MNNITFQELIERGQLRIPQIQRDYAQGRRNRAVDEIRENFVRSLLLVVSGKKPEAQLDFVYGSERDDAFEPLDGQQRLTTLFLLHWVLGCNLKNAKGESVLTYETRATSKAFCDELVTHEAKQFIDEAKAKSSDLRQCTPSEIIRQRDWFQWAWRFDPTISSMLVVIDAICRQMDWTLDLDACRARLQNITFKYLDLGQLRMSDELFIKMNARGKPLSDFDKLKSTLEEEIQQQQHEQDEQGMPLANAKTETLWRQSMDGKWIDLFWQQSAKDIQLKSPAEQLKVAKQAERNFRIFLMRMIAMQIFAKMGKLTRREEWGAESDLNKLYEAAYKNNESNLSDLLLAYQNQLTDWRSNPENGTRPDHCVTIDFNELIESIDLWIIGADGQYADVCSLLPSDAFFSSQDIGYFSLLTSDNIGNDVTATIYAMQLFLKHFPSKADSEPWRRNFEEWTRMARNVFNNDNNTDRLNRRQDLANAFSGINRLVGELAQRQPQVYTDPAAVVSFIKSIGNPGRYIGIDGQSLQEEADKAALRLSDDGEINREWTTAIRDAERDPYLWGQIRAPLHWAEGDVRKFRRYVGLLTQWIGTKQIADMQLYYTAMLCLETDCWEASNRLYEFNKDRDNSLKRYLRDAPYGLAIKRFIDKWMGWNAEASFQEFCRHVVATARPRGWVGCLRDCPEIIWYAWRKRVFRERGHVVLAQQKTTDSHCFDPVLLYLGELARRRFFDDRRRRWSDGVSVETFDSKSVGSYGLTLTVGDRTYAVRWAQADSLYVLDDGSGAMLCDADSLVSRFKAALDFSKDINLSKA